ncbi:MAG: hypothetical protein K6U87_04100 [Firmicutes bacterium]|nr:hypothetical protein [Bacillota bacterium]
MGEKEVGGAGRRIGAGAVRKARSRRLDVWVNAEEYELLEKAAARAGLPLAALLRMGALAAAERILSRRGEE